MMKKKIFAIILVLLACPVFAAEFTDGRVKLVINEHTGRFSLYYMAGLDTQEYLPFFEDKDPRTSLLSVMVNNRDYKMGESSLFKTSLGGTPSAPALIFESSFLTVTEQFSFIKTGSSPESSGVMITITLTNKSGHPVEAGIRFLVDTVLGEKEPFHFYTDARQIGNETIVERSSADKYWVSKNSRLALMGSIAGQNLTPPDEILFSNWKRFHDSPWKPSAMPGRNFNMLPYSVNDSAVCYFYNPSALQKGNSRTVSLVLSGEDEKSLASISTNSAAPPGTHTATEENTVDSIRADLALLEELAARLDEYAVSEVPVSDEELAATSLLIFRIKSKYGIP